MHHKGGRDEKKVLNLLGFELKLYHVRERQSN
jgi:hypothetical protein